MAVCAQKPPPWMNTATRLGVAGFACCRRSIHMARGAPGSVQEASAEEHTRVRRYLRKDRETQQMLAKDDNEEYET